MKDKQSKEQATKPMMEVDKAMSDEAARGYKQQS